MQYKRERQIKKFRGIYKKWTFKILFSKKQDQHHKTNMLCSFRSLYIIYQQYFFPQVSYWAYEIFLKITVL